MKERQPEKAPRQLAALALGVANAGAPALVEDFGSIGAVASAAIPTSMAAPGGIVIGFVAAVAKTSGIFFVKFGLTTGANANGAAQSFQAQITSQAGGVAPTIGTTRALPGTTFPVATVASGETATLTNGEITGGAVVGGTTYYMLVASQSAAGAFALASNAGYIEAQEIGA